MVRPERRTRSDVVAAAAIAVVVAVVAGLIWWTSDARATDSRSFVDHVSAPAAATEVPAGVRQLWTVRSAKTVRPVVAGGALIAADGRTVDGRDPATGSVLWTYARDRELCGVTSIYNYAVAVYPDTRGCGQVSTIDGSTGRRGPARSGYADKHVDLSSTGTTVLAAGPTRLETWRSDMVRVIGFGEVDARVKPIHKGIGEGCTLTSSAASGDSVSVLQACPDAKELRLTLMRASDQDDEPELRDVALPGVDPASGARILFAAGSATAVYLPTPQPRIAVFDDTGTQTLNHPLRQAPSTQPHPGDVSSSGDVLTWWTGRSVLVFAANGLAFRYAVDPAPGAVPLGPGTLMAGKLLVPVTGGIGVFDRSTGVPQRVIPVDRTASGAGQLPVVPTAVGNTLIEQRGDNLVALG